MLNPLTCLTIIKIEPLALFLLFTFIISCYSPLVLANQEEHTKQLQQIRKSIKTKQQEIRLSKRERAQLEKQLQESEVNIGKINQKLKTTQKEITKQTSQLKEAQKNQLEIKKHLTQQQKMLAKQMRSIYQSDQSNWFKLLLNQEDPQTLSLNLHYFAYLNDLRLKSINTFKATVSKLQKTQALINKTQQKLHQLEKTQLRKKENLQKQQRQRKNALQRLDNDINLQQNLLDNLIANKKRLNDLIAKLKSRPQVQKVAFNKLKGKLPWPTAGQITINYGEKTGKQSLPYNGVFIKAKQGHMIKAVAAGKIVFSDWIRGFGLLMIIDQGNGYMTLYAHCQSLLEKVGNQVYADKDIATVGNSGGQTQSGLFLQIRHNGQVENPTPWFKGQP